MKMCPNSVLKSKCVRAQEGLSDLVGVSVGLLGTSPKALPSRTACRYPRRVVCLVSSSGCTELSSNLRMHLAGIQDTGPPPRTGSKKVVSSEKIKEQEGCVPLGPSMGPVWGVWLGRKCALQAGRTPEASSQCNVMCLPGTGLSALGQAPLPAV